ncbi:MAG: transcription termination factor NusA [Clostridia bacterium]|nr:transcription termination factor NusA [Clostridia bacterium]
MEKIENEFISALDDLEKEKGISKESFMEVLKSALALACRRQFPDKNGEVDVTIDEDTGKISYFLVRHVSDNPEEGEYTVSVEDAQKIVPGIEAGQDIREEFVPGNDFSRIAAQTAKQVILQKIHESERESSLNEMSGREGELMSGVIRKIDQKNVYIDLGKGQVEGVMVTADQVPGERYNVNDTIRVFVKKVRSGYKNTSITVSRTSPGLVRKLFEEEVPEIKQGQIQIKEVSRDPGSRSKVAIYAADPRIDAIGACVGNKGARVNAIVEELNGEKIDIIPWSENPLEFIAKALSPAKVLMVTELEGEKSAMAIVPDDKLSLAIGKDGQNARLAVRLTGWKIDVKSKSAAEKLGYTFDEEN